MACGTGKTFTSLKIAETETNGKGLILFLVPSIALLGQTLNEWTAQANEPINAICICSDSGVSKKRKQNEDSDGFSVIDLALPASTNVSKIVKQFQDIMSADKSGMTVVFSTYQSINVIAEAQLALLASQGAEHPYGVFDLIICDEHHRCGTYPKPNKVTKLIKERYSNLPMIFLSGTPHPESYSQIYHQFWISNYSPLKSWTNFY